VPRQRRQFRERFGDRLRDRREVAGLTQTQLARKLPGTVEGGQVSRWERGESFPTYANLVALARALECSEESLLCGRDHGPALQPADASMTA
jgi:transcriptional regulator with XRE-family HTH domain